MNSSVKGRKKKEKEGLKSQHEYSEAGTIIPYITSNPKKPNCLWCLLLAVHVGVSLQ